MRTLRPPPDLAPFVRDFVVVETGVAARRLRLPELGLVLGFRSRGAAHLGEERLPNATLAGLARSARTMHTEAGSAVVLARFRPAGAARFFRGPLHELADQTLDLEAWGPRRMMQDTCGALAGAHDDTERVAVLSRFLRTRPVGPVDSVVQSALRLLQETGGRLPIRELARMLAISQDPLEKRFRRAVGASPKRFASLVRFTNAVSAYRPGLRLAELAVQAGYFDQSHFVREVRAFTGLPPSQLFRDPDVRRT